MLNDNAPRSHVVNGLQTLAVAGAYFAAAKVGLQQELVGGQVTPLWPPTGIALACSSSWACASGRGSLSARS